MLTTSSPSSPSSPSSSPANMCGTFDGFSLWNKDPFLAFLDQFARLYGFDETNKMPIALYEWQVRDV